MHRDDARGEHDRADGHVQHHGQSDPQRSSDDSADDDRDPGQRQETSREARHPAGVPHPVEVPAEDTLHGTQQPPHRQDLQDPGHRHPSLAEDHTDHDGGVNAEQQHRRRDDTGDDGDGPQEQPPSASLVRFLGRRGEQGLAHGVRETHVRQLGQPVGHRVVTQRHLAVEQADDVVVYVLAQEADASLRQEGPRLTNVRQCRTDPECECTAAACGECQEHGQHQDPTGLARDEGPDPPPEQRRTDGRRSAGQRLQDLTGADRAEPQTASDPRHQETRVAARSEHGRERRYERPGPVAGHHLEHRAGHQADRPQQRGHQHHRPGQQAFLLAAALGAADQGRAEPQVAQDQEGPGDRPGQREGAEVDRRQQPGQDDGGEQAGSPVDHDAQDEPGRLSHRPRSRGWPSARAGRGTGPPGRGTARSPGRSPSAGGAWGGPPTG